MDRVNNILSLLGLALRGSHLVVGEEPVEGAVRAKDARVLLLASDAADNTVRRTKHFAEVGNCIWLPLPCTKAELGRAVGRSAVAIVAVTDIGLASAVVHRLADIDPVKYGEAAERLDVKAKRAAQRKAEQRAHEKNVRTGKYKPKKAAATAPVEEANEAPPAAVPAARKPQRPYRGKPYAGKSGAKDRTDKGSPAGRKSRGKYDPYAHSRPVKKGKGSFRKKDA